MNLNNYEDWDELEQQLLKTKRVKRNGKRTKIKNDKNVQKSQDMPADWREGDSYIGRQKKKRNRNL